MSQSLPKLAYEHIRPFLFGAIINATLVNAALLPGCVAVAECRLHCVDRSGTLADVFILYSTQGVRGRAWTPRSQSYSESLTSNSVEPETQSG